MHVRDGQITAGDGRQRVECDGAPRFGDTRIAMHKVAEEFPYHW
jgi:hypothetical protein